MSAKFWYYPEPNGSQLVEIDLGEDLGELFSDMQFETVDAVGFTGGIQRSVGRTGEVVTIQRDRLLLGEDLAYQFTALQNHLDRGYSCAFSADHTKAWAAPLKSPGNKAVTVYPCPFNAFTGSVIPSADDYIVIETRPPAMLQEQQKIDSVSLLSAAGGGTVTIDKRLAFSYGRAFARWYRFWPVLKRPQGQIGQSMITNENGRLFSLSITLTPDYDTYFSYHPDMFDGIESIGTSLIETFTGSGDIPQGRQGGGIDGVPKRFFKRSPELEGEDDRLFDDQDVQVEGEI